MQKIKRKICVVTANRADFSRLETVLESIQEHEGLELQLVVIGSHLLDKTGYTVNEIDFPFIINFLWKSLEKIRQQWQNQLALR
ncbi:MAG: hypothetical protein HYT27_04000 [Parcubacteria group bacterium]|nr:hypothetical protein [Parcubacteria group bacterium]